MGKVNVDLNHKTIPVTGSPGFIGANLVLQLLKDMTGWDGHFSGQHERLL